MLRIQSGFAKGMVLESPKGLGTRPTSGKVRAAVLNSLMPHIPGAVVLDLCAGSGAMGLELLSRGAQGCTFVENDRQALTALRQNVRLMATRYQLAEPSCLQVKAAAVESVLPGLTGPYDLIWADPPYRLVPLWAEMLATHLRPLVTAEGVVAIESGAEGAEALAQAFTEAKGWCLLKAKNYGQTYVSLLQPVAL